MKTTRFIAIAPALVFLVQLCSILPGLGQVDGLPKMIRETEKGVFFIRVLDSDGKLTSSGTAFMVDSKGTLVTALHVLRPGPVAVGSVEAVDKDGKTWAVSGVAAHDASVDLALMRLEKAPAGARPVALAGNQLPERGAKVLVLGHPQGFQFVATDGIVSATHKTDQLPAIVRQRGLIRSGAEVVWIQTTAAVAGGNSGGPMLDASGKVIGVVQWITGAQGMNFGVHVASVRKLLAQPTKLVSLKEFTQPDADFSALMREFQIDVQKSQMKKQMDGMGFGFARPQQPKTDQPVHPSVKYAPKLRALAETYRGKDVEFRVLMTLMSIACEDDCPEEVTNDVKIAADRLIEQFKNDRQLLPFLQGNPTPKLKEAQKFLGRLAGDSKDPETRAVASLVFAQSLAVSSGNASALKYALEYARAAAGSDPKITHRGEPVADIANRLVEMLTHSVVGCKAPELSATDQHGEPLKLADLRGKSVVVAFYTEQSEFQGNISTHLNQIVSRYPGAPLCTSGVLVNFPNHSFSSSGGRSPKKTWRSLKDDADGTLRKAWHISDDPTVFLIDDKGVIVGRFTSQANGNRMGFGNDFFSSFFSSALPGSPLASPAPESGTWQADLIKALDKLPAIADPGEKLVAKAHEGWRYFEGGKSPGENWAAFDFDDSKWKTGQAPLGYGEKDLKTTIGFGGKRKSKNRVAFFRTRFAVNDPSDSDKYAAGIRCDDGAVVYLNGAEVFRHNVKEISDGTAIEKQLAAAGTGSDAVEAHYWFFEIGAAGVLQGENVIAVSVHQAGGGSSDLALDLELVRVDEDGFSALKSRSERLKDGIASSR